MSQRNKTVFNIVKWIILISAYVFLVYKLSRIDYWVELKASFSSIPLLRLLLFIVVLLLMPFNWMIEAKKWQRLNINSFPLSFGNSLKAVLAGLNTGFVTPNRIGDFAGRILFLPNNKSIAGVALSMINSLTQNLITITFGLAGAVVYFMQFRPQTHYGNYLLFVVLIFFIALVVFFTFPDWIGKIKFKKIHEKLNEAIKTLSTFNKKDLMVILLISMSRYVVYSFQFYLMLQFFGIHLSLVQAFASIPAMYLFVTITPSMAAAEPAIRSSYAVLVFSIFSSNQIGMMLCGIVIWIINFVIPMLAGSFIMAKQKRP